MAGGVLNPVLGVANNKLLVAVIILPTTNPPPTPTPPATVNAPELVLTVGVVLVMVNISGDVTCVCVTVV